MATVTLRIEDATSLVDGQSQVLLETTEVPWEENMSVRTVFERIVDLGSGPFYAVRYRGNFAEVRLGYALHMVGQVKPGLKTDWRLFVNESETSRQSGMDNTILNPSDAVRYVFTDFGPPPPEHLEG